MRLSPTEQERENQQRRASDRWEAEIQHRNATLTAVCLLVSMILSGSYWLGGQSAKEEVEPTRDLAKKNAVLIEGVMGDIDELKHDSKETLKIVRELFNRK